MCILIAEVKNTFGSNYTIDSNFFCNVNYYRDLSVILQCIFEFYFHLESVDLEL